jgi:Na+-transporting methylmalonyl-CoA/oxaloacetate decarboxylase gamma subunit
MGTTESAISDAFGIILVAVGVVLAFWEVGQQRNPDRDRWFVTPRRFRRRMAVSILMGLIGVLIALDARKIFPFTGIAWALGFAGGVGLLAIVLFILAAVDFVDTVNAAARKSLADLEQAMKQAEPDKASQKCDDDTQVR